MDSANFEKQHDEEQIYCRRLGRGGTFGYCRRESVTDPCSRIVQCWIERIDILGYLEQKHGAGFVDEFLNRGTKDKITSIIEIVEKAKKRVESENKSES